MEETNDVKLKEVTKVAWLSLREPFQLVYSGVVDRVDVKEHSAKIYRVGKVVRIDIVA